LALTYLYHTGRLNLDRIIRLMSGNPASLLGLKMGKIEVGGAADIVVFDPDKEWLVSASNFKSKAKNSPFIGMKLRGKVATTVFQGNIVYMADIR